MQQLVIAFVGWSSAGKGCCFIDLRRPLANTTLSAYAKRSSAVVALLHKIKRWAKEQGDHGAPVDTLRSRLAMVERPCLILSACRLLGASGKSVEQIGTGRPRLTNPGFVEAEIQTGTGSD